MKTFDPEILKKLYKPPPDSHKGQNGKLLLIGGSKIFHAASLWSLKVASRIVDMVFYSSIPENNQIVQKTKQEFRDGIVVSRNKVEDYINEADCILIGPGLPRKEGEEEGDDDTKFLTEKLLKKYPNKKWVIDGGSLQMMDLEIIPGNSILTPHKREFEMLKLKIKNEKLKMTIQNLKLEEQIAELAKEFNCVVLLKGEKDYVCSPRECTEVPGGDAGMTKGGTGDVLAGLVAALYCKNDAFISACSASFINKKAGESLFKKVGYYFNSSDLVDEIPKVMKELIF
ncbi:MAG: NAD(P)H-hydrate dehydratase [Candidatus Levybacteria bacterium RIFCSPLOWO2_02_FULL_37_10]|nr:MAG: NAD(P)H-hydrate dehydratase [Candidatus Levybacteria bacterium RIFCSPHIGHO2_01_FULL_37_33]OGH17444.1 MAG: NAD(P)H-hydrate dehydratase [Candidatus Levybacteria bacterium RIFCSPHIGHO2_02_FULL_37_11]OGH29884.1 MAG: NAD(P)H-hydrate dehydratase [Candidatus Levybacteria bacterium RIFCSPHIGHO2_12_FULL_37_12]OGH32990.1 MAG: NAD(P)H-hydrate dehydratase [Candidatus Levybacteria bacterium RIFCSPLOWO2_01_FULL_36_54]OGH43354.1 MAG: NAD(P)H-hydrate dehydratase [Candidatus Levybacteria bacterium RIFCS